MFINFYTVNDIFTRFSIIAFKLKIHNNIYILKSFLTFYVVYLLRMDRTQWWTLYLCTLWIRNLPVIFMVTINSTTQNYQYTFRTIQLDKAQGQRFKQFGRGSYGNGIQTIHKFNIPYCRKHFNKILQMQI